MMDQRKTQSIAAEINPLQQNNSYGIDLYLKTVALVERLISPGSLSHNHVTSNNGGHFKNREFSYSLRFARYLLDYARVVYP